MAPTKQKLRDQLRALLQTQSPAERREKSRIIGQRLFDLAAFKAARCVCFYLSLPEEVDTSFMVDEALLLGKRVALPRCEAPTTELRLYAIRDRRGLVKNSYGISEPVPDPSALVDPAEVNLAVVPGVVFDRANNRLGRGRGFYDRFLKKLKAGTPKIGLAYAFQVVETVPVSAHDVKLDLVITD